MGRLEKHITDNLTEEKIQSILGLRYLTPNSKMYEMENLFVFDWESDYLCITKSGYIHEIEIKISRSDFANDFKHKKKKHLLLETKIEGMITKENKPDYFYYAVPEEMISENEIPEYAGLIYVYQYDKDDSGYINIVKSAPRLKQQKTDLERLKLERKFYFQYRNWKANCGEVVKREHRANELLKEAIDGNGGTKGMTYSQLEHLIDEQKEKIAELEQLKNQYYKDWKEEAKYANDLRHFAYKNKIELPEELK